VQKERWWTDNESELVNGANRFVRDAFEDLKRLRACNETSKLMIKQSQRLIAEMSGGRVHYEIVAPARVIIRSTSRNNGTTNGTTWMPNQQAPSELLVAEARHIRAQVKRAYQSCLRATETFTETRAKTRRLVHEASEVLRWDVGWRL
jgi:hypothetical protein